MIDMRIAIARDGTFSFEKDKEKLFVVIKKELSKEEIDALFNSFNQELNSLNGATEPIQESLNMALEKEKEYVEKNTSLLREKLKEINERVKIVNETANKLREVIKDKVNA